MLAANTSNEESGATEHALGGAAEHSLGEAGAGRIGPAHLGVAPWAVLQSTLWAKRALVALVPLTQVLQSTGPTP